MLNNLCFDVIDEVIGSPGKYLSRVEKEVIEGNGINELQELKDNLLHRHNNYITNLKHEISKKKKKEKLPTVNIFSSKNCVIKIGVELCLVHLLVLLTL